MLNALQKLVGKKAEISTYELIGLQAKTHRSLKTQLSHILDPERLSSLDWHVLGILSHTPQGCRYNEIAAQLAVEPPFVTELVAKLEKEKIILIKQDITDRRAKKILLTKKGQELVADLEKKFQEQFAELFKSITPSDLETFKSVMLKISEGLSKK